jgi:ABC-type glycerol-3-phosphate transport system permease component
MCCTRPQPPLIQAASLMTMAVPVVVSLFAQPAFMRGVVARIEK